MVMDENRKLRIISAIAAHDAKNNPRHKKPTRTRTKKTNSSPESDLVKSFLTWTKSKDIKPWFSLAI